MEACSGLGTSKTLSSGHLNFQAWACQCPANLLLQNAPKLVPASQTPAKALNVGDLSGPPNCLGPPPNTASIPNQPRGALQGPKRSQHHPPRGATVPAPRFGLPGLRFRSRVGAWPRSRGELVGPMEVSLGRPFGDPNKKTKASWGATRPPEATPSQKASLGPKASSGQELLGRGKRLGPQQRGFGGLGVPFWGWGFWGTLLGNRRFEGFWGTPLGPQQRATRVFLGARQSPGEQV